MATLQLLRDLAMSGARTSSNVAVASGVAYFYLPGSLTQTAVYTDVEGLTAHTQPITLDSEGKATVYVNRRVRMLIQTSAGVTVIDSDTASAIHASNIITGSSYFTDTDLASNLDDIGSSLGVSGATDGNYLPHASATQRSVKSRLGNEVWLDDFPAVGNGATDDIGAFNSALTYLNGLGGGVLWLGHKTYAIGSAIAHSFSNVSIRGQGRGISIIKNLHTTDDAIRITSASNGALDDFQITHTSASTGKAIQLVGCSSYRLAFLRLRLHYEGVNITENGATATTDTTLIEVDSVMTSHASARALHYGGSATTTSVNRGHRVFGGYFGTALGKGIYVEDDIEGVAVYGARFASTTTTWHIAPSVLVHGYHFSGCTFDSGYTPTITLGATCGRFSEIANEWVTAPTITDAATAASTGGGRSWGSLILGRMPFGHQIGSFSATAPGAQIVTGAANITIDRTKGNAFAIVYNGGATSAVVTIDAPTGGSPQWGDMIYIAMGWDASGVGVPTWTFAAGYQTGGTVGPAVAGDFRVFTFMYDAYSATPQWRLAHASVTTLSFNN